MSSPTRRQTLLIGAAALAAGPALARSPGLQPTPNQTEGPFYPYDMPEETDPDLVRVAARQAKGEILAMSGRVLRVDGQPVAGAMVEIWQCDANGRYIAAPDRGSDPGFQGFGRVKVDSRGAYAFRTIRPVPYPGRTPHIHIKVHRPGAPVLTSQMFVDGDPGNARDGVLRFLSPPERARVMARLERGGEGWRTNFDLVIA